jgi:membrane protease subunit (stomatin/prohibitin family)
MGIFNKLRNELIDIIEWVDDSQHTLVWRFPRYQNEIKNGAQLIVRPGQKALFVREGKLADLFEPGTHELTTKNLPLLSTLAGWKYGFDSPFKAEVYFVSTRQLTDLKWGTPNPIMLRDADFGPVRLRAFGNYSLRAIDPKALLNELVGTDHIFDAEEVGQLLRSIIASTFADVLGSSGVAALDLASKYRELGELLRKTVNERIDDEYGLEVPQLTIVNIALPESVEKALDQRSQMGVLGDMQRYQQFQVANALTAAANNPSGGGASEGLGLGMGLAMAQQMMHGMQSGQTVASAPSAAMTPPPPPAGGVWHIAVNGQTLGPFGLSQLAQAVQQGQVTATTSVWSAGMAGWQPAGQVPQLATLFGPPPPPPVL